jgi:ubiquinone/menaquinone biosynthesis C-methylase UbiE
MATALKDWDQHVIHAEEVARLPGFQDLRARIVALASIEATDRVVDVGAGTGLLALSVAPAASHVWAVDISAAMLAYLDAKARSAGLQNIELVEASAVSLPLVDRSVDVAISNYCLHHLSNADKRRALAEIHRVLKPGGRLVFGDMMFTVSLVDGRDRRVLTHKVAAMVCKGPAGLLRLAKNIWRFVTGRWESPARAGWWRSALEEAGFVDVSVEVLDHEGGIAAARRPGGP